MTIDPAVLNNRFLPRSGIVMPNAAPAAPASVVRPRTEFWINVGFGTGDAEDKFSFLSLPLGIPLDSVEPVALRGTNQEFLEFRSAQNHLLSQIVAAANELKPGQAMMLPLQVQLRRISGDPVAPEASGNRFLKTLFAAAGGTTQGA